MVIVTDVNGVFSVDPKSNANVERIKNISAKELVDLGRTSVDSGVAKVLDECNMECIVVGCDEVISTEEWNYDNVRGIGTVIRGEKIND